MSSRIRYNDPKSDGSLGSAYHLEMLLDQARVKPFENAIRRTCPGKRVLESGTGSGIMSLFALSAGAERVYATEIDPRMAAVARENFRLSGMGNRIKLIERDTRAVTLDDLDGEPVDVAIAENLSTWEVTEPQISIMNHINAYLMRKGGIALPEVAFNTLELAYAQYEFADGMVGLKTHSFGFTGIPPPEILSEAIVFRHVDFREQQGTEVTAEIAVPVTKDGLLNSIRCTSPLQIYQDIHFQSSDSLMPPVTVPLENERAVSAGETIRLQIYYPYGTAWELFRCRII